MAMPIRDLSALLDKFPDMGRLVIIGPGPSLLNLRNGAKYDLAIFIGDSFLRSRSEFANQVLVRANTEFPSLENRTHVEMLNTFSGDIAIASSVMESETPVQELAKKRLPEKNIYLFDQRHFNGLDCNPKSNCCDHKQATTIQEEISLRFGLQHHYSQGSTVFLHALSIAIMMQPKTIDIFGVDLPMKVKTYDYVPAPKLQSQGQPRNALKLKNISFKPGLLLKSSKRRLFFALLPQHAPSVFAEDFMNLFQDVQMLSDMASLAGISVRASGSSSILHRFSGISEIVNCSHQRDQTE